MSNIIKLLVPVLCTCFVASSYVEVNLDLGKIRGSLLTVDGARVGRFLGIPYAKPPLKSLRFKKPVPLNEPWQIPLNATQWPNLCPQLVDAHHKSKYRADQSEDCLYLNIWSPRCLQSNATEVLKPVFVYIHGGGYFLGSSSDITLDGAKLARRGDILVVTLNYRLGPLGFLYVNEKDAPGNVGIWDQNMALQWIKKNIHHFGGNPDQVTISGESAGGTSVSLHVLSPFSEKLFQKAIIMSGPVHYTMIPKTYALEKASKLAVAVGCRDHHTTAPLEITELNCMRAVNVNTIVAAQFKPEVVTAAGYKYGLPFAPLYGDNFMPFSPSDAMRLGQFKKNSSILLGTVTNEGVVTEYLVSNGSSAPLNKPRAIKLAVEILANGRKRAIFDPVVIEKLYFGHVDESKPYTVKEALHQVFTDGFFDCPTNLFAEKSSKSNEVYRYVFAYPLKTPMACGNNTLQPCHLNDVPMVFGTLLQDPVDHATSVAWGNFLVAFVKGQTIPLPRVELVNDRALAPYYIFYGKENYNIKYGYKYYECSFWSDGTEVQTKN